jgi:transposase-like protein
VVPHIWYMQETKRERWTRLIAEQGASGEVVRAFCRERGVGEKAFYWWRRRLRSEQGVHFALVETMAASAASEDSALELVFTNGERLRIGRGVDRATLQLALTVIRA